MKQTKKQAGKKGSDARWKNKFAMCAELSRLMGKDYEKYEMSKIREIQLLGIIRLLRKCQGLKD